VVNILARCLKKKKKRRLNEGHHWLGKANWLFRTEQNKTERKHTLPFVMTAFRPESCPRCLCRKSDTCKPEGLIAMEYNNSLNKPQKMETPKSVRSKTIFVASVSSKLNIEE